MAKRLRGNPTFAEKLLWAELRQWRADGAAFRRQVPIGPYVADFVCYSARLIVELDGGIHALTAERDAVRDAWLSSAGFRVLRFSNDAIIQSLEDATSAIKHHLQKHR